MPKNMRLHDFVQVRTARLEAISLIGLKGNDLDDQHRLFTQMKERSHEIQARTSENKYLVILPGLLPLVAVEGDGTVEVPAGMTAYTIPEQNYAIFHLEIAYIGDFWNLICTEENQATCNIDLSKPRFERFTPELQSAGRAEWHIPLHSARTQTK